jgi:hypothetical protein
MLLWIVRAGLVMLAPAPACVRQGGSIPHIALQKSEARPTFEQRKSRALQRRVVVVVQVVETHHRVPALQQALGDAGADEAGGSGDEDLHRNSLRDWLI